MSKLDGFNPIMMLKPLNLVVTQLGCVLCTSNVQVSLLLSAVIGALLVQLYLLMIHWKKLRKKVYVFWRHKKQDTDAPSPPTTSTVLMCIYEKENM